MKNRRLFSIHTAILAVLLVPAPMSAQGPVNLGVSVPDHAPPLVPRGTDPAPGLYGLRSGAGQVYAIDATTGEATFLVASNGLSSLVGLSFLACDAYGSDLNSFPGGSGSFDVGQIDLASGGITFLSDQDGSANWHGLATDEGSGLLYSIDIDDGNILKSLAADGTVTLIGAGTGIDGRGMAFDDANGILYATDSTTASLYTVSLVDGTATLVGPTGLGDLGEVGLAYDETNDILYLNDAITASLYTVSLNDGGATLVGANLFPNIDGLAWLGVGCEEIMFLNGVVTGTVNGTRVELDVIIELNFDTGEETASISGMPPEMGAILRQVTALVTIGGPGGGKTIFPLESNLFDLSGGNFSNLATIYWPETKDTLEVIHNVTFDGGNTMSFLATMDGTVPIISIDDEVVYSDFEELLVPVDVQAGGAPQLVDVQAGGAPQLIISGVGYQGDFSNASFRHYLVGNNPIPVWVGKGNDTHYMGDPAPGVIVRTARDISTTYDPNTQTMHVHLFNELTLQVFADGFESGSTSAWGATLP